MRGVWLAATFVGCAYHAGSFGAWGHDFAGERLTLGCLDLAVDRRPDGPLGAIVAYDLGNRCDHAIRVDFSAASVIGRTGSGDENLAPYDPKHELHARWLDGRAVARETVEYRSSEPLAARDVCVDAGGLVGTVPYWQCFVAAPEEQIR